MTINNQATEFKENHTHSGLAKRLYVQVKLLRLWLSEIQTSGMSKFKNKKAFPYGLPMTAIRCKVLFISTTSAHVLPDLMIYILEHQIKWNTH